MVQSTKDNTIEHTSMLSINQPVKDNVEHHFHVQVNTILRKLVERATNKPQTHTLGS